VEFLVRFDVTVPEGTPDSQAKTRFEAETVAAAELARKGHLVRLWRLPTPPEEIAVVGIYRADSEATLDALLGELPLADWMRITVTQLGAHPNDPRSPRPDSFGLPEPRLDPVYHLEATLGDPVELGDTGHGRRRIVPLTGGAFDGPKISGKLLPGASADWQTVLPDGTALGDIRYTLQTREGDVLYVQSRSVRHGDPEVLARLARGEDVDPSEYTFRTSTRIETTGTELDWLNKGVFISVGGRRPGGVTYETYLVR